MKKYKKAKSNLEDLEKLGASLLHEVDATKMKLHTDLSERKFDRIIFNFPHAGFYGKEDNALLIKMHRNLVQGFFRNATGMLRANGEVHVNHKTKKAFCNWNIDELALSNSLLLVEIANFRKEDYPGYNNKRGDGVRCDEPFLLGECSTFKFRFCPSGKRMSKAITTAVEEHHQPQRSGDIVVQMRQQPTYSIFTFPYSQRSCVSETNHIPLRAGSASIANLRNDSTNRTGGAIHQQPQGCPTQRQLLPTSEFIYPRRNHIPLNIGLPSIVDMKFDSVNRIATRMHLQPQRIPIQEQLQPTHSDFVYSLKNQVADMNRDPRRVGLRSILNTRNASSSIYDGHLTRYHEHPNGMGYSVSDRTRPVPEGMWHDLERKRVEVRRTFHGDLYYLREQHPLSILRSKMIGMQ